MLEADLDRIRIYHRAQSERWGLDDPRSLGFADPDYQTRRFEVILGCYDFGSRSILDIGCGVGDFAHRLSERHSGFRYRGIDNQEEFITKARERFSADAPIEFFHGDFSKIELRPADAVVASGSLSYRMSGHEFHRACIARLFHACRDVFIFNLLDATRLFPSDVLIGHGIGEIEQFCRGICQDVSLIRGYLYFDVTFVLRRSLLDG